MKSFIFTLLCCLGAEAALAQIVFTSGTSTHITPSTTLYVSGLHFQNNAGSSIEHQGTVVMAGNATGRDLRNNGLFDGQTGTLQMRGSTEQQIQGNQTVNIGTLEVDNAGNGLSIANTGALRIHQALLLSNGRLFTADTSPVLFATTAVNPIENNTHHIRGTAIVEARPVNAGAFATFLNFSMPAGGDVGSLTLTRRSGDASPSSRGFAPTQGTVNVSAFESIDAHWQVDISNTGAGSRDFTISWLSDWDNAKDLLQMQVWRTETPFSIATPWFLQNVGLLNLSARSHTESAVPLATLRNAFTVSDLFSPLPIDLLAFDVRLLQGKDAWVNWRSKNEKNIRYYEIQRSADNLNFETIATQSAQNLAENSYQYTDVDAKNLGHRILYYRLVQVEADESKKALPAKSVQFDRAFYTGIYPNPFREALYVKIYNPSKQSIRLQLTDNLGRALFSTILEGENIDYQLSPHTQQLPAGAYFLKISQGNSLELFKVVKQ